VINRSAKSLINRLMKFWLYFCHVITTLSLTFGGGWLQQRVTSLRWNLFCTVDSPVVRLSTVSICSYCPSNNGEMKADKARSLNKLLPIETMLF